jgi:hypothetical protein
MGAIVEPDIQMTAATAMISSSATSVTNEKKDRVLSLYFVASRWQE